MKTLFIVFILTLFVLGNLSMAATFKKVRISATNNTPFFIQTNDYVFPLSEPDYLIKLKKYVEAHGFKPNEGTEVEFALNTLSWVTSQWDHDGMNEPPKNAGALEILELVYNKKEKFRCVEYGAVLSGVLQAYGFITRKVALRSNDVAYGGFGQGHVAMEIWINELGKWVFLDGQFGAYITLSDNSVPLNYFEIFSEKLAGKWEKLQVHFAKPPKESNASESYKDFLKNYFGNMAVTSKKDAPVISLLMEAKSLPLTFQGSPVNNVISTTDSKIMYPEMNRVSIILNYQSEAPNFQKIIEKFNIKTDEDFKKNMGAFIVEPKFTATLLKTDPWFEHFEYRNANSGAWKKLKDSSVDWDATGKVNRIEARSVNKFGRPGPTTFIEVIYE
ncbi:MAG: hypothetical protein ACXVLQ_02670 [Bacteriovorax sp.]